MNVLPVLPIILPLGLAFLAALALMMRPGILPPLLGTGALIQAGVVAALVWHVARRGPLIHHLGGWTPPLGITLVADELAVFFLLLCGTGLCLAMLHALAAGRGAGGRGLLLLVLSSATAGWSLTGDLFNLFVFVELSSVAAIGLTSRDERPAAAVSAFIYLLFASLSGLFLLLGIALLYGATGTLNLARLVLLAPDIPPHVLHGALACILVSFGIKIGILPLHFWKVEVYTGAGGSTAAVLSGVLMSCGVYGLARILWTVGGAGTAYAAFLPPLLLAAGCVNVLAGHVMALLQRDLRRLLTFSSIAHAGYILLGLGLGSVAGLAAAFLHTFYHLFMKMAAFWSAEELPGNEGALHIAGLRGAARLTPLPLGLFMLAALALVGVPPLHGFASKWWLARTSWDQGMVLPVLVIATGTFISMAYYARIMALSLKPEPPDATRRKCSATAPVIVLPVLFCLLGGLLAGPARPFLHAAARRLNEPSSYARLVFPEEP